MSRILTIRLPVLVAAVALPFTSLAAQYGTIQESTSLGWGAILSFASSANSAVEILDLRQDTDVTFSIDRHEHPYANPAVVVDPR